jgi:type IV pilus assembly protein PilF
MKVWSVCCLFLLTACAGGPSVQPGSEQAVSQQTATTEVRNRAKIHTELGGLYLQDQRFGVALEEARIAIEADSSYAPAYNLLALVHMFLQEHAQAEDHFQRALRLAPADPEINNNYGWFLCQSGRERQSIEHFMVAVKNPLYSTPARPLSNLGQCYQKLKDDKAAEEFFLRAIRLDNGNAQALFGLGELYYRNGRPYEARKQIGELHKRGEPNAQSAWLGLLIERKTGDREAEARYNSILRRKFQDSPEYQKLMQGQYQ